MLTPYRRVLSTPGAVAFSLDRLHRPAAISMVTLGIVLLVVGETGSYGLAGAVSACFIIGEGVAAPLLARVIDRLGQGRIIPIATVVDGTGLAAMLLAVKEERRHRSRMCWPCSPARSYPRSAPASEPGGRTPSRTAAACTRRTRSRRWSTSRSSWSVRSWSPCSPPSSRRSVGVAAIIAFAVVGGLAFASLRSTEPPTTVRSSSTERHRVALPGRHRAGLGRARLDCSGRPRSSRSRSPRTRATAGWSACCWRPGPAAASSRD